MAPPLPTELVSQIIKRAGGDCDWRNQITSSRLCRVNKSFLPFARDELYSVLVLKYRQLVGHEKWQTGGTMVTIGGYGYESSGEEDEVSSSVNDELLRTLRESPHLATLVRRLILNIHGQDRHKDLMERAADGLVDFFTSCKGTTTLALHKTQSPLGLDLAASKLAKAGLGTQLVNLSAPVSGPGVLELLTKLPHLRGAILNFEHYRGEDEDSTDRYTFPFSLETLYLTVIPPLKFLAALTANSSSTLRRLHIDYSDEPLPELAHITGLETLSIYLKSPRGSSAPPAKVFDFLATQPSLRTLHVNDHDSPLLTKDFLLRLPSTLTFLNLEGSTALPADVIAYISQPAKNRAEQIGLPLGWQSQHMKRACRYHGVEFVEGGDPSAAWLPRDLAPIN